MISETQFIYAPLVSSKAIREENYSRQVELTDEHTIENK